MHASAPLAAAFALFALPLVGCEPGAVPELVSGLPTGAGGSAIVDAGGADADAADADSVPGPEASAPSPVVLALSANPEGDAPSANDELGAVLTALAAGARGFTVRRRWSELGGEAFADVATEAELYAKQDKQIAFELACIDRLADGRPPSVAALAWDHPDTLAALHESVDLAISALGSNLRYVTFGREVDLHLEKYPEVRSAFVAFAAEACSYAREHPDAPAGLKVGVGLSVEGASSAANADLLAVGDVAAVSYLPRTSSGEPSPASAVSGTLDTLLSAVGGRPVVFTSVGHSSSGEVGSGLAEQELFFQSFFAALGPRRSAIAFADVFQLHDLGPHSCSEAVLQKGETEPSTFASFYCSVGLFTFEGQPKPAWDDVLGAMAAFATP